jgi:peptidyl-prolyl cis-trans isomerase A (cyclophilin A)
MKRLSILCLLVLTVLLGSCRTQAPPKPDTTKPEEGGRKMPEQLQSPSQWRVRFDTNKGPIVVEVYRDWAPRGADRFYELVRASFFENARFFRVVKGFVVQWGLSQDPEKNQLWSQLQILDDPVKHSNERGTITFAKRGPNTRTTQIFINLKDNKQLDADGFAPFGKVVEGMDVVDKLYSMYGDGPPRGSGPDQNKIIGMGNEYLVRNFPQLDFIQTARIVDMPETGDKESGALGGKPGPSKTGTN